MSNDFDANLSDALPRRSVFKGVASANSTVRKRELVEFHARTPSTTVKTMEQDVEFLISGECLLDGRASFFSLDLKTNAFTAVLSNGVSSLIKRVQVKLPSNSNQVVEDIQQYNYLDSIISLVNTDENTLKSKWNSGSIAALDNRTAEGLGRSARFLNLNKGGYRKLTFALTLSAIFGGKLEQYIPLFLLNGLSLTITLALPTEAFRYDEEQEQWGTIFEVVEGMPLEQDPFDDLERDDPNVQEEVKKTMLTYYNRPVPRKQQLEYEVKNFTYHASCLWFPDEYYKRLIAKAQSGEGLNLFYDSYHYTLINNDRSDTLYANLSEQFQNLKTVYFVSVDKTQRKEQIEHFCTYPPYLKSYQFRQGSRYWNKVENDSETAVMSYTQSLLSSGLFHHRSGNTIDFPQWGRNKNVHVFSFERVDDAGIHSGINTTDGNWLRLECALKNQDQLEIGGAIFERKLNADDAQIYFFFRATSMLSISNKGIAITN